MLGQCGAEKHINRKTVKNTELTRFRGIYMSYFITSLKKSVVASTRSGVKVTDQFKNILADKIVARFKVVEIGEKDGSHFIRTALKERAGVFCMSRGDSNAESTASLLVIDCDRSIDSNGEELDTAPNPRDVSKNLKSAGIGHILFGSYSYYCGLMRYRIILVTNSPYSKEQLSPTAEAIVALINVNLSGNLLAYASENAVWSQPWYYPRKPSDSIVEPLYIEYLEGNAVDVVEPQPIMPITPAIQRKKPANTDDISPIHTFNERNSLTSLLSFYGYKRVLVNKDHERWLSPDSSSGMAGITVKNNQLFCHHSSDPLNDGYWHDAFDLMRVREGLTEKDAVIKAVLDNQKKNGQTLNQHNKRQARGVSTTPEQTPLPEPRPNVMPFHADMLPTAIRDHVLDVADRQQSLPDFVAVAAIVGLSGLLGRKALIYPKQLDDWAVTPNQWGAIIGRPSAMKSPSMKEALKPLRKFDIAASNKYKEEKNKFIATQTLNKLERSDIESKAKTMVKEGNRKEALTLLTDSAFSEPTLTRQRLVVNDSSVEKLGELLNENPNGLILVRDELAGWLAKLAKEEFQSERAFYLECFDGNGSYTYDRIGRGTIEIQNCTLSVIGGIQPTKIATLVCDALKGTADDGLIQRFQLAIWPDDIGTWDWIDRAPNQAAKKRYDDIFQTIYTLSFNTDNNEPYCFRFTPEAQKFFIEWMVEIQAIARGAENHPALESHMLKMPQTIAGLALLFEIIDGGRKSVGVEATARALDWADYLLSHAKRLYSLAIDRSLDGAQLILARKEKLPGPFSARDVQRKGWSGLNKPDIVNDALSWLIDYGYIQVKPSIVVDTNGRPTISYEWVNSKSAEEN